MAQNGTVVGIDCGKDALDVAVFPASETLRVANTAAGYQTLMDWLNARGIATVGIEASGGYERAVRNALTVAGITVRVQDPARVRHFAQAKGQRAKTDPIDAAVIAEFTAHFLTAVHPVVDLQLEALAALLKLRRHLVDQRADLTKTLDRLPEDAQALAKPVVTTLDSVIQSLDGELTRRAKADVNVTRRAHLLQSAPGVGAVTALTLAVRVPELGQLSGAQAAALLGVAPYPDDSGHHHGARHIAGGRDDARRALYMAAMVAATRCSGTLAAFYARLIARGKPAKVALTACMRKLIVWLNAMLAHDQPWKDQPA